jgi:hypothetical protein
LEGNVGNLNLSSELPNIDPDFIPPIGDYSFLRDSGFFKPLTLGDVDDGGLGISFDILDAAGTGGGGGTGLGLTSAKYGSVITADTFLSIVTVFDYILDIIVN